MTRSSYLTHIGAYNNALQADDQEKRKLVQRDLVMAQKILNNCPSGHGVRSKGEVYKLSSTLSTKKKD